MTIDILMIFITPFAVSFMITPLVERLALRLGAIDQPSERKIHTQPTPRLGGVAVCGSFLISYEIFHLLWPAVPIATWATPEQGLMVGASLLLILIVGVWDDLRSLGPGKKFLIQLLAGTLVYVAGFRISSITHP